LLLCPGLLICRLLLLLLLSLSRTSSSRPSDCTNCCALTRVSGNGSNSCTKQRAACCSTKYATLLGRLLLRSLLSFSRIKAGLLNRPLMAFKFIFLLLFDTLALCRVDHHSRIRENDKSQPRQKKH
jgi:hypothetical protein